MAGEKKKLAIIDGKSVFYRGYYAMPNLSTMQGVPTGGVFGFATMALELIKKLQPDYVCVAWDKPKTNIRKRLEVYSDYKAGRKPAPPDFYTQIPILHELLDAFGWPLYELDDYEADDIMGTLAVEAEKKGIETLLITSDLDVLQLVTHHVKVYALKRGFSNIEEFHPESFEQKYGLKPEQFLDLKALKGDSSDNIPGVPGIGEKTAVELLKEFKTLDDIYKNLDKIKDSTRKKLEAGKDSAYMSKKVGAIWCDAPIKLDVKSMDGKNIDVAKLRALLEKLEFRSLLRGLPANMQDSSTHTEKVGKVNLKLPKNVVIDSHAKLLELKDTFAKSDQVVVHSRASGKNGEGAVALLLSADESQVFSIKYAGLSPQHLPETLGPLFANPKVSKVGHDIKSTIKVLDYDGIKVEGVAHDSQIAAFLINPLARDFSLSNVAYTELGYGGSSLDEIDEDEYITRAPEIIAVIRALTEHQLKQLKDMPKLAELARTIEFPVIPVLADMEVAGIKLDLAYMKKLNTDMTKSIGELEKKIYKAAGHEFNIGSPSQLSDVLFNKLSLPTAGIKKTQSTYSTAASELAKLRSAHPIIDLISEYREVAKLKSTYVDALPKLVDSGSRLHTTFNLTIAATGRLSSTDPNLQNIPVRTDLGKEIRHAFIAEKSNVLISADYSQFELRLAASLSGDKNMIESFNKDADIHAETAAELYSIPIDKVTKTQRSSVKEVNFGILYGLGPHALSQSTGMTFGEARDFIARYFEIRPKLKDYIAKTRQQAVEQGYVETLLGRRRPTPDVHSSNFVVREAAYRAAVNMPLQGSAADIMKLAMVELGKKLPKEARMLVQVHDSILLEVPKAQAEKVGKLVKDTMESAYTKLPVKLKADISIGNNWGEL